MPIRVKATSNGHNPGLETAPPTVEADVVEELDMYAYAEAQERPDPINEPAPSPETKVEVKLRSFIPVTAADFEAGFRLLTDEERKEFDIPDRSLFRVREDAGKNVLNLSSQRVGTHIKELMQSNPPYPRGYLIDAEGLTDRCLYEVFKKIVNTSKNILPASPRDWRHLKKTKKEFNPRWKTHRFKYWEVHSQRCRDYYEWLEAQPQPETEIHDGEFVSPIEEPEEDRAERLSKKRSQIQTVEREDERIIREYCRWKREQVLKVVQEEALETRYQVDLTYAQTLSQPETTDQTDLEDEEDL